MTTSKLPPDDFCDTPSHKSPAPRVSSSKDARAVRSQAVLRDALLVLLERQSFDQVSVKDICAEANVHYATFYRHYIGKEQLLDSIAADQINKLISLTLPTHETDEDWRGFIYLCEYVQSHRALWTTLLNGGAGATMRSELLNRCREVATTHKPINSWLPGELGAICSASWIAETLSWWLAQPEEAYSTQDIANIMHRLLISSTLAPD